MKMKILIPYLIVGGSFLITYLVSCFIFPDVYLLSWTYENSYLYIWVIALLLLVFKKKIVAYAITLGNIAGLIGGHVLDKIIMPIRMAEITEDMSVGEVYMRSEPNGAFYWMGIVLVFIVVGSVITWVKGRKTKR